jgi:hypothetical protein
MQLLVIVIYMNLCLQYPVLYVILLPIFHRQENADCVFAGSISQTRGEDSYSLPPSQIVGSFVIFNYIPIFYDIYI